MVKKKSLLKNTWYDWLINFILESIKRQCDKKTLKISIEVK